MFSLLFISRIPLKSFLSWIWIWLTVSVWTGASLWWGNGCPSLSVLRIATTVTANCLPKAWGTQTGCHGHQYCCAYSQSQLRGRGSGLFCNTTHLPTPPTTLHYSSAPTPFCVNGLTPSQNANWILCAPSSNGPSPSFSFFLLIVTFFVFQTLMTYI